MFKDIMRVQEEVPDRTKGRGREGHWGVSGLVEGWCKSDELVDGRVSMVDI